MDEEWNQFVSETGGSSSSSSKPAHLRNEDFRKLLGSTRGQGPTHNAAAPATHSFTHRHHTNQDPKKPANISAKKERQKRYREKKQEREEKAASKEEEDTSNLNEILKNYRDRAAERRKGESKDDRSTDSLLALNGAYKAVPGDPREVSDAALRKQQAIEESKYLGGDIEHTHLVRGLDYSLLNKVRSEIAHRDDADDEEQQLEMDAVIEQEVDKEKQIPEKPKLPENRMVRNLHTYMNKPEYPKRNELFAKGRMAYIIELEDEESELPTTLVRSVQDCPVDQTPEAINANNMLIQKLNQVLSYLRADTKKKKKPELNMTEQEKATYAKADIFDDAGTDYVPSKTKSSSSAQSKEKTNSYFGSSSKDKEKEREREREHRRERDHDRDHRERDRERDHHRERDTEKNGSSSSSKPKASGMGFGIASSSADKEKPKRRRPDDDDDDAYAELFPSGISMLEAGYESDEDADYSKMDMGNKKGPLKRWDFDTQEEYEKYRENQEALPKAAFQYGKKTNDGRKTRKNNPESKANEKQKFDREYNQIMKHMEKRKPDEKGDKDSSAKRARY